MKKLTFLLVAIVAFVTSCTESEIPDLPKPIIDIIGEETCELSFSSEASEQKVSFTANYDWSVISSEEWIKVSPDNGKAGEACEITVSLEENDSHDDRAGVVTIAVEGLSVELTVVQAQKDALLLTTQEVKLPQAGGSFDVVVKSNIDFSYVIKADWITAEKSRALTENVVRFEAKVNPNYDSRNGEIVFKGGGFTETVTVTQSQNNVITLSTSTIELDTQGGNFSIQVSSNVKYDVAIDSACDWISQVESRALTTSTLNFQVSENTSESDRSATITISGGGLTEEVTVKQKYSKPNPNGRILYTSTDGNTVQPKQTAFDANIVSNTYKNGQGVIEFDADLTAIKDHAFYGLSTLKSVILPPSVTSVGNSAFRKCESLIDVTIPNEVKTIGEYAFCYCTSLATVVIPHSVTELGDHAFESCESLVRAEIGNGITYLGFCIFDNCIALSELVVGTGLTYVEENAFYNCNIKKVYISDLKEWCKVEFEASPIVADSSSPATLYLNGKSIKNLVIPDGVEKIGSYTFINYDLLSVVCSNSVTFIGEGAFSYNANLKSVELSNNLQTIKDAAFAHCPSLTEIKLPETLSVFGSGYWTSISINPGGGMGMVGGNIFSSQGVFANCTGLTTVTIPANVTVIEGQVFDGCENLQTVYCEPTTPPTIANATFPLTIKIYAHKECYEAYLTSWSKYKDIIYPIGVDEDDLDGNVIYYTTSNGDIITPKDQFDGAVMISNTYQNGQGVMRFSRNITLIGNQAFYNQSKLTSITIPKHVTTIEKQAFYGCSSLKNVGIPASVTSICENAFQGCSALSQVDITDISAWCKIDFKGYYGSPLYYGAKLYLSGDLVSDLANYSSITEIKTYAFLYYKYFTDLHIPNSVTSIDEAAFCSCSSLSSLTIPESVASIGNSAFSGCTGELIIKNKSLIEADYSYTSYPYCTWLDDSKFTKIRIGDNVTKIGKNVFYYASVGNIEIPNGVTSIGSNAFYYSAVKSVTIPESVISIGDNAFEKCKGELIINSKELIETDYTESSRRWLANAQFEKVTIGDNITRIGSYAFYYASSLPADFVIPNSVSFIGKGAFKYCRNMKSVTLPKNLTEISASAFKDCEKLTTLTIPDGVKSIGKEAFSECASLKEVYSKPITPPTGGIDMFFNCASECKIYVPQGSVAAYKAKSYWSDYANSIVGYDF